MPLHVYECYPNVTRVPLDILVSSSLQLSKTVTSVSVFTITSVRVLLHYKLLLYYYYLNCLKFISEVHLSIRFVWKQQLD